MRLPVLLVTVLIGLSTVAPAAAAPARPALTNLAHLNYLSDTVTPPGQPGHTTYRLGAEPGVGVLWTYADRRDDGHYDRIGGGDHDPVTDTFTQGAFNADDVSRAAVVYLRHWRQTRDQDSRRRAYGMLRGLTYLQTADGPDAGNVVLWMQPDGTLNPSARPVELPDPSDSGPSYWLARTVWALGEGYAAFRGADPGFAAFLRDRLDLAIGALNRQVLDRYGQWQVVDGVRVPAWLVVDGADASAEAVLGLSAYVEAGGGKRARTALARLAEGIAAMSGGDRAGTWPYGAILPWALSRSNWHGWGAQMPAALAVAARTLHRPDLRRPAMTDAATFTPYLLTAGGPDNGWLPAPVDRTQIAYGADSRVRSLLAVGSTELAGIAAGWFFGANVAGTPTYDPATGRTYDGVGGDGVVNRNSGAESTIHGLLTMLALDAARPVADTARDAASVRHREGPVLVEGEAATLSGGGEVVTPPSAWTGESQWSGGAYLRAAAGTRAVWQVPPADQPRLVQPVVDLVPDGDAGRTRWSAGDRRLGTVDHGSGGAQGNSPAPGALIPVTLPATVAPGAAEVSATATGVSTVDAVLLRPEVGQVVYERAALLQSAASGWRTRPVDLPGAGRVTASSYDGTGHLLSRTTLIGPVVTARVAPGGYTVLRW